MKKKSYLAVDIGGSKLATGLMDERGTVKNFRKLYWLGKKPEEVLREIDRAVGDQLAEPDTEIAGIGITIPGIADAGKGIWVSASFMGIYNVPIKRMVEEKYGIPTFIENDTNACCLAEKMFGSGKENSDFIYLTVSNGIGGALFLNNRLYYGATQRAGELGMCVVQENGWPLEGRYPLRGSLEMHAAGRGLVRNYIASGGKTLLNGLPPDGESIAALAGKGDPAAKKAFELEGYYLGKVIAAACNILDPQKVIIGGGLSLAFEHYGSDIHRVMCAQHHHLEEYKLSICIEPTSLGYYGGLIGAGTVAVLGLRPEEKERYGYRGQ